MPTNVFFHVHVHFKLQSRQDNHRLRGDTPRMAQTSKFCKEYRRYQRTCADCAHRSAGRGARGQRSAPARRSACALASVCGLTCNAHMPLYPRPSTFDVGLGGLDWGACSLWSMLYGEGRGPERRRAIDHRGVHGQSARRASRSDETALTRATPSPDLDIVLSFLAAHPQSTPHKLIAVCWTGDRRRCSCGDELV